MKSLLTIVTTGRCALFLCVVAVGMALIGCADDGGGKKDPAVELPKFLSSTVEIDQGTPGGVFLEDNDQFGASVAAVGDLYGNGGTVIAVGADQDDTGGAVGSNRGAIHLLSYNATGALIATTKVDDSTPSGPTLMNGDGFGASVAAVGDLYGNGGTVIAVGADQDDTGGAVGSNRGAIHLLSFDAAGALTRTTKVDDNTTRGPMLTNNDQFGASVAAVDLDGNGGTVIAVGATGDDTGTGDNLGAIYLLSFDAAGALTATTKVDDNTTNGPVLGDEDNFGTSIAAVGDLDSGGGTVIAVGADQDDTGATDSGAIHLLSYNAAGDLTATTKVDDNTSSGPTLAEDDNFGTSVAAVGDLDGGGGTVGANGDNTGATDSGAIHLLSFDAAGTLTATTKVESGTPNGPTLASTDNFGIGVAAVGDLDSGGGIVIAVGATGDDTGGSNRGAIHLLSYNAAGTLTAATKVAHGTTNGPTLASTDFFGISVAAVGDLYGNDGMVIAVGATQDNTGDADSGALHLLSFDATGTLTRTDKIASGTDANGPALGDDDFFGRSVAAVGDLYGNDGMVIAVGATGDDTGGTGDNRRGAIHLLSFDAAGTLTRTDKIASGTDTNGPTLAEGDNFGRSVAAVGDLYGNGGTVIAVGATGDDTGGDRRGAIYLLSFDAAGTLTRTDKIDNSTTLSDGTTDALTLANKDFFGISVAAVGDLDSGGGTVIAVGANQDDTGGTDSNRGAIYLLSFDAAGTLTATTKVAHGTTNGPTLTDNDLFGISVAAVGDLDGGGGTVIAVGANQDDTGTGDNLGAIYLLSFDAVGALTATTKVAHGTTNGPTLAADDFFGIRRRCCRRPRRRRGGGSSSSAPTEMIPEAPVAARSHLLRYEEE